jgi:murein tripeptide amidase MpaA
MSARLSLSLVVFVLFAGPSAAAGDAQEGLLPPPPEWAGESLELAVSGDHAWATVAEATEFEKTATHDQTVAWLRRLADESPAVTLHALGRSHEGRRIWMVVASSEGVRTPTQLRSSGKPTLFVQAGIHSGEIDGKPAGMMLLRDLTVTGNLEDLLDRVNLLFVPILNVDGHERASRYARINQRGPSNAGWRTNARNLNLNRDYSKLDTPELRALIGALDRWDPDLYYDVHVTDGIDYQYDITYGWNGRHAWSPAASRWLDEVLRPTVDRALEEQGHVPGPLVFAVNRKDPDQGIWSWTASPRFSNGYGSARHLPTVLVENHSLKPFRQRVMGTRVLLEATLRVLAEHGQALRESIRRDRAHRPDPVTLSWSAGEGPQPRMSFRGIRSERYLSPVSGDLAVRWTGEPVTLEVPVVRADQPEREVARPVAYWIPPAWHEVIDVLQAHGIELEPIEQARTLRVEAYRFDDPSTGDRPYEGRVRIEADVTKEEREMTFPAGSVRVPTDQPLGTLAVLLLEPESRDSLFRWGFFNSCLQRTEYAERYALEPLARRMMDEDPELRQAFERALAEDEELRNDVGARLAWFYQRSPWYDARALLYPVAREVARR